MVPSNNLSGPDVATRLERHSAIASGTALHPGKNLAVSPELNRFVTVRISFARKKQMTGVTCYLFNLCCQRVVFGLSSLALLLELLLNALSALYHVIHR